MRRLLNINPILVINYGTAGGIADLVGLHKVAHFVQVDMDVRGLDFPRGITPLSDENFLKRQALSLEPVIVL